MPTEDLSVQAKEAMDRLNQKFGSTPDPKDVMKTQRETLERIMKEPAFIGEVVRINNPEGSVLVSQYGKLISLVIPEGLDLKVGDMVRMHPSSSQILDVIERFDVGSMCSVSRVVSDETSEVDLAGVIRSVSNGQFAGKLESGDRVVLDSSGSVIVGYLGKGEKKFRIGSKPSVHWDEISGLESVKEELRDVILAQSTDADLFKFYNVPAPSGIALIGPPGCGKTMLIEAFATQLLNSYGPEALEEGFILVKGPELFQKYVGDGEKMWRVIFALAKKFKEKYNRSAVIAIDEADAVLRKRGSGISSDVQDSMVPAFLAEVSGLDKHEAIIIISTNRVEVIDPAVLRDGRIDRKFVISRPTRESATQIFKAILKKYPVAPGLDIETLAQQVAGEFYSDQYGFKEVVRGTGEKAKVLVFKLAHLINGAMAVGVIEKAVRRAFRRDRANGASLDAGKRTGITLEDLMASVNDVFEENKALNHSEAFHEFVADFRAEISDIRPITQIQEA